MTDLFLVGGYLCGCRNWLRTFCASLHATIVEQTRSVEAVQMEAIRITANVFSSVLVTEDLSVRSSAEKFATRVNREATAFLKTRTAVRSCCVDRGLERLIDITSPCMAGGVYRAVSSHRRRRSARKSIVPSSLHPVIVRAQPSHNARFLIHLRLFSAIFSNSVLTSANSFLSAISPRLLFARISDTILLSPHTERK